MTRCKTLASITNVSLPPTIFRDNGVLVRRTVRIVLKTPELIHGLSPSHRQPSQTDIFQCIDPHVMSQLTFKNQQSGVLNATLYTFREQSQVSGGIQKSEICIRFGDVHRETKKVALCLFLVGLELSFNLCLYRGSFCRSGAIAISEKRLESR